MVLHVQTDYAKKKVSCKKRSNLLMNIYTKERSSSI